MTLALIILLGFSPIDPVKAEGLWEESNTHYRENRFIDALAGYEHLLAKGVENGALHYNAANTYMKNQQLGKAILHYAKARKFLPNDPDITANLAIADAQRVQPIEGEDEAFAHSLDRAARGIPYRVIFLGALALLIIGGLASLWLILKPTASKGVGYVMVIGCILGLCLTGIAFMQYKQLTRDDLGVLIANQAVMRSGPANTESENFTIHEGVRCRILDETEGWYRISLANGYNGWVPRASVGII